MTVAVMQPPARRGNTEQILDAIGKGLQLAQAYYGVKTDMAKYDEYKANQELNRKALAGDIEYKDAMTQTMQARLKGKGDPDDALTQKDLLEATGAKGSWNFADENTPGAKAFPVKGGAKAYLTPRQIVENPKETKLADDGLSQKELADLYGKGWKPGTGPTAVQLLIKGGKMATLVPPAEGPGGKGATKLSAADQSSADKALDGLVAVGDMRDAIDSVANRSRAGQGWERMSFVKDTPFTEARTRYTEAIGRLASGGAINKDEEARFVRMAPGPLDDYVIAQTKLNNAYAALAARLEDRGLNAEEAITKRRELAKKAPQISGGFESQAMAAPTPAPSLPKAGDILDGYRFKGGNLADPRNWEKI